MAFPVPALPEACEEVITRFCNEVLMLRDVGWKPSDKEKFFPLAWKRQIIFKTCFVFFTQRAKLRFSCKPVKLAAWAWKGLFLWKQFLGILDFSLCEGKQRKINQRSGFHTPMVLTVNILMVRSGNQLPAWLNTTCSGFPHRPALALSTYSYQRALSQKTDLWNGCKAAPDSSPSRPHPDKSFSYMNPNRDKLFQLCNSLLW